MMIIGVIIINHALICRIVCNFTPTSDTPFDPFEVTCLSKDKWKVTEHDYKNYEDSRGDGYQCFYSRSDVTASWEKEIGIYQE